VRWKKSGDIFVGERQCDIRSLKIRDELGRWRRFRVCTVWKPDSPAFSKTAATGRLARLKEGRVGILITGRNMGYVKVGKSLAVQPSLMVGFEAVSRLVRKRLTRDISLRWEEVDGFVLAWEENS